MPFRTVAEAGLGRLTSEARAVVCGTAGRRALPAAYLGARRARVPFVLWSALWHEPRTPAHLAARPLMRHIHRRADAVVTYGPHVSAHARRLGRSVFALDTWKLEGMETVDSPAEAVKRALEQD